MNLSAVREAAAINMLEITDAESGFADLIRTELWCIREGINTEEHPEIWDVTLGSWTTSSMIVYVLDSGFRNQHDQAAMLLCTMKELS